MNSCQKYFSAGVLALLTQTAFAQSTPPASSGFAVLGNAAVSCTDGNISGQVGTNQAAGDAPPGAVALVTCPTGGAHVGDAAAKAAYQTFLTQYAALAPKTGDVCTQLWERCPAKRFRPGLTVTLRQQR